MMLLDIKIIFTDCIILFIYSNKIIAIYLGDISKFNMSRMEYYLMFNNDKYFYSTQMVVYNLHLETK